ncbi:NUDIX hydrolase [Proteiniborus sp. DW1]|uniref:NUDIX hydrolase n=1 Tax=Proteiniborus sp. DW1 TaxID=1889883 RepID=UPI00092E10EC|nr:CoA pyrophosphatase [Proteiniborus sp. DW1]SCG84255.1 NUDIX hydrolase [Proteiniborus sp. DW1]
MDFHYLEQVFKQRKGSSMDLIDNYAILLPLINMDGKWHILFEVRSEKLDRQPNEISFPGGKVEGKETFKEGAIRETCEELNIKSESITLLGELDYVLSSKSVVYGYVGVLEDLDVELLEYNRNEVGHVFTVPLDFFLKNEPEIHYTKLEVTPRADFPYHLIQNGRNYNWNKSSQAVYFYVYEDYVIWGLTARFVKNFVDIINRTEKN